MSDTTAMRELMTPKEAAEFLRVKPRTIYDLVRRNDIPYFYVGKQLRFNRSELRAHCSANQAATQ